MAGIELTDRGYIKVNERLETTAPGVWAIGEVAGSPQFTHVSVDDFRVVRDNLAGGNHVTTGRQIPYTLFTDPELARIGLNEKEAKARGISYRLFKIPMEQVLRARTLSETRGFLKALVEVNGDRILGFTAFAVDGGEIMASVQTAMMAGLPYTALRDAIWAHPTLVEGLSSVVLVRAFAIGRYTSGFAGHGARPSVDAGHKNERRIDPASIEQMKGEKYAATTESYWKKPKATGWPSVTSTFPIGFCSKPYSRLLRS